MDKNLGARLNPYAFKEEELLETIDRLLNDAELNQKLQEAAKRIQSSNSKDKVCQKIEQMVEQFFNEKE